MVGGSMIRLDCKAPMTALLDLTGQTFGRLTVVCRVEGAARVKWECQCSCGNTKQVQSNHLTTGKIVSCGCWLKESVSQRRFRHGAPHSSDPLLRSTYQTWCNMRRRCGNPRNKDYARYGGKGIAVCERWSVFQNFLDDLGIKPTAEHGIDRIDYKKGYEPGNCRWADVMTQALNKSDIILLEYKGKKLPLTEWCRMLDKKPEMVRSRIRAGWSTERALETLPRKTVTA